ANEEEVKHLAGGAGVEAEMRALDCVPVHGDFGDFQAKAVGEVEELGVEGPGVDALELEETDGRPAAKDHQGGLAVRRDREEQRPVEAGEGGAGEAAGEATARAHVAAVGLVPYADRQVGAGVQGGEEGQEIVRGGGQIGIDEADVVTRSGEAAGADSSAFTAV